MAKSFQFYLFIIFFTCGLISAQVNTERFRINTDSAGFSGNVNISATAITGNTDFQIINAVTHLYYDWGKDYTFFVGNAGYGWQNKEAFSNEALAHLRYVIWINNLLQTELFIQFNYNKKRLLLARELYGTGIRLKLITEKSLKIRYGLAYMFEREEYDLPANSVHGRITNASRISSYATFNILLKDGFLFISVTYFQPKISNWKDFKSISDNSFVSELSSLIDLTFGVSLRYDSRPPDAIKKLDTVTKFGLSIKF
jgi:putative salt-induced outer membrane protein YdiY